MIPPRANKTDKSGNKKQTQLITTRRWEKIEAKGRNERVQEIFQCVIITPLPAVMRSDFRLQRNKIGMIERRDRRET